MYLCTAVAVVVITLAEEKKCLFPKADSYRALPKRCRADDRRPTSPVCPSVSPDDTVWTPLTPSTYGMVLQNLSQCSLPPRRMSTLLSRNRDI